MSPDMCLIIPLIHLSIFLSYPLIFLLLNRLIPGTVYNGSLDKPHGGRSFANSQAQGAANYWPWVIYVRAAF